MLLALLARDALAVPTLEEVIGTALRVSPTVQMGADDLSIADHSVGVVASSLMPRISASSRDTYRYSSPEKYIFDYSYDGTECDPTGEDPCIPFVVVEGQVVLPHDSWSRSRSLSASQSISVDPVMDLILQRERRVSTTIQVRSEEESLIFDLLSGYTDLQYQRGLVAIYDESLALAEELETAVAGQHAVGEATAIDLDSARLDTAQARLDLLQLHRAVPLSLASLAQSAGIPALEALAVCDFGPPLDAGDELDLSNATSLARLQSSLAQETLTKRSGRLALIPDVSLNAGLSSSGSGEVYGELADDTAFDSWYVGTSLSTTLFDGGASRHQRRSDVASLHRAQVDLDSGQAELVIDDQELAQSLVEIDEEAVLLDVAIEISARDVVATRAQYFEGGQVPLDAYTQARSSHEQLLQQRLALSAERQMLTAMRWISAGHTDALIEGLLGGERALADAERCPSLPALD
jgi:outer membrane protein TolC